MSSPNLNVIILAAGKGTRMKSQSAKVLHEVFFHPMVHWVVSSVTPLASQKTIVIVGHQHDAVRDALTGYDVLFAMQEQQLGTGHAVLSAAPLIDDPDSSVMIICGDSPLIRTETLEKMYSQHLDRNNDLTLMTTCLDDPTNYGRILKDGKGDILGIVEQKDANPEQLKITEINAGIYIVRSSFLFPALQRIGTDNSQGEMYLTDIVEIGVNENCRVDTFLAEDPAEILGVNSRIELAEASSEMQRRKNRQLMAAGITMSMPDTIIVSSESTVGQDTFLEGMVRINGKSSVGAACKIGQGTILHNVSIGDKVTIGPYSYITGTTLETGKEIPPYSHISSEKQ